MRPIRLAVVTTHPIQYQAPWFRALAARPGIDLKVFFGHQATAREQADAGFGLEFEWDVSLLDGYQHCFMRNVATKPSLHSFGGIDNPDIKTIISQERFDAVIINGWHYKSAWQTMRACWKTRTPVMARSDSTLRTERGLARKATKLPLYRWFVPKLDACLPVGTWSRDYFLHYGARPDRIFVVPHVVDPDAFTRNTREQVPVRELRRQWQLDEDATVFLFAGKFVPNKRPLDFVKAISAAHDRGAQLMGLMVGDGPLRQACEEEVRTSEAPVRFAGFVNQSLMPQAYAAADVLVLPSGDETWGMVVNEAMAGGKPCLVSDRVGCGPDLIVAGETGEIFRAGDVEHLTSLLEAYSTRRDRLMEMSAGIQRKVNGCSMDAAIEGVVRAIDSVTNGSAGSAK
jgi:glycosyltransferase involved in cell wall biosynthesis